MKKLFLGSFALLIFSLSIFLFQVSCKREAVAEPSTAQQIEKILYTRSTGSGTEFNQEVWIANYDGSNPTKVNYTIPNGISRPVEVHPFLSSDGKTVFLNIVSSSGNGKGIYSCNVDGTNMKKIIDGSVDLRDVK